MELSRIDKDLLQLVAIEVPWPMVCGEFHGRYGSVDELVRRLFELLGGGLLQIACGAGGASDPDPVSLRSEAVAHGNFEDIEMITESDWCIVATNKGYAIIETELDEQ